MLFTGLSFSSDLNNTQKMSNIKNKIKNALLGSHIKDAIHENDSLENLIKIAKNTNLHPEYRKEALGAISLKEDFSKCKTELFDLFMKEDSPSIVKLYSAILLALLKEDDVKSYLYSYLEKDRWQYRDIVMTNSEYEVGLAILALEYLGEIIPNRDQYFGLRMVDSNFREK